MLAVAKLVTVFSCSARGKHPGKPKTEESRCQQKYQ